VPFDVLERSPCLCDLPKNNGIVPGKIGPLDALEGVFGVCGILLGIAGGEIVAGGAGDPICAPMGGKVTSDGIGTSSCFCFCALPKNETGTPGNIPRGGGSCELC
jgi:hypothetical protein